MTVLLTRTPHSAGHTWHAVVACAFLMLFLLIPLASAAECVPGGPSVACSTPEAVLWDSSLQELDDPSGRAVRSVHQEAY